MKKLLALCLLISNVVYGQLGFCEGSKGDPIFIEDFGAGQSFGPQLPTGVTNYTYSGSGNPLDGSYTIYHSNNYFDWHNNSDHTPNDSFGKLLIVNADYTAGEFYQRTISGLCENTSYEFTSWIINLLPNTSQCQNGGIPINVKFEILNPADNSVLASGDTGNIPGTSTPLWQQYGLTFTTPPGQTDVILKMLNNGVGGCGNDLGLDDIMFRSCGDLTTVSSNVSNENNYIVCEDQLPITIDLTATPDFSIYQTHVFQWQESSDNINWVDIALASNSTYTTPNLTTTTYYRVKVAEDAVNLQNALCNSVSDSYTVEVAEIPAPPAKNNDVIACTNEPIPELRVTVGERHTVNWYASAIGGVPILENSTSFSTTIAGTYYAETQVVNADCISLTRTAVTLTLNEAPILMDEVLKFCKDNPFLLDADFANASYLWSTGDTTEEIYITKPGTYTVLVTTPESCSNTKTIHTTLYPTPAIKNIKSDLDRIIITPEEDSPDFEYSINDSDYQDTTVFEGIRGGLYIIYARDKSKCQRISKRFIHLEIPRFFTPNGDGINDLLIFYGIENYVRATIKIFNRYGALIHIGGSTNFSWDGNFNGRMLPASDYWYEIIIADDHIIKGHISLKR